MTFLLSSLSRVQMVSPRIRRGLDQENALTLSVYYFRWIMHNFSTPYALGILKSLIPALKAGARIVINDHCLREPGSENPWDEKLIRSMDMVMLTLLNSQERTEVEFRELFRAADSRFLFKVSWFELRI